MESVFILYQQNPTKQILLYDMATSSSVLTFLKMHSIQFSIKNLTNTEFMSENGRMPVVIEEGSVRPMCGFKEVFWHVSKKIDYQPALLELAYIDWIESNFLEAETYICWCFEPILNDYTKGRYMHDLPWPVSTILFNRKRDKINKTLGRRFDSLNTFFVSFSEFLKKLSRLIGNKAFCSNNASPSAVNALIYGHAKAILSTKLHPKFVEAITWQKRIENLVNQIEDLYPS